MRDEVANPDGVWLTTKTKTRFERVGALSAACYFFRMSEPMQQSTVRRVALVVIGDAHVDPTDVLYTRVYTISGDTFPHKLKIVFQASVASAPLIQEYGSAAAAEADRQKLSAAVPN